MTIHHATVKRAEKNEIILTEKDNDDLTMVEALWPAYNQRFIHRDPKIALAATMLAKQLKLEYPAVEMVQDGGAFTFAIGDVSFASYGNVPDIADVLAEAVDQGLDPEEGFDDVEVRQVVPQKYKDEYRARGNVNHCGDWLAEFLDARFTDAEGRIDIVAFLQMCFDNGVVLSEKMKASMERKTRGWKGRVRMNARQKLEVELAVKGTILVDAEEIAVDADWLADMRDKHAKAIEKRNKVEA